MSKLMRMGMVLFFDKTGAGCVIYIQPSGGEGGVNKMQDVSLLVWRGDEEKREKKRDDEDSHNQKKRKIEEQKTLTQSFCYCSVLQLLTGKEVDCSVLLDFHFHACVVIITNTITRLKSGPGQE